MSIKIDLTELKKEAKKVEVENKAFFARLKKRKPKTLDDTVADLHDEVFENIDCLECANCCKCISPIITQKDADRLAKHLKMKISAFTEQYLYTDADGDYVFKETPCPFLMPDNYCMVYDQRPKACREYPHTDRQKFYQILDITLRNTFICPAVFEITEKLKEKFKSK